MRKKAVGEGSETKILETLKPTTNLILEMRLEAQTPVKNIWKSKNKNWGAA